MFTRHVLGYSDAERSAARGCRQRRRKRRPVTTVAEFTDQEWEQGWHDVLRSDPVARYLYDLQVRYDDDMEGLPEHLRVLRNDPVSVRGRDLSGYEIGHHLLSEMLHGRVRDVLLAARRANPRKGGLIHGAALR